MFRARTLWRAQWHKSENELDRGSSFTSPLWRVGRLGARRYGRAVSVGRATLTALALTELNFALPGLIFAYPSELEA